MSRTLDLLADSDIHGTPDGYRAGCKTGHCPSPVICRDVYVRYVGDWSFARRVDAGESAVVIIAAEIAEAAAVRERDAAAARAEKRREHAKHVARERRITPAPQRVRKPKPKAEARPKFADLHGAEIARLNGEGVNDSKIAAALGLPVHTVRYVRGTVLKLPPVVMSIGGVTPDRFGEVAALHAENLDDGQIAERMGTDRMSVWKIRTKLGLPIHQAPRKGHPGAESKHLAAVRAAHGEGLTDAEIAARVGISKAWANALRNRLELPPNTTSTRSFPEQPHGTTSRYRSGCRCDECRDANAAMARRYREAS